jgi:hypothetical protein
MVLDQSDYWDANLQRYGGEVHWVAQCRWHTIWKTYGYGELLLPVVAS